MNDTARGLLAGGAAGCVATVPMSAVMGLLHQALPTHEQYPLPPREVTMRTASKAGLEPLQLTEGEREGLTTAAHFTYGTTVGAIYGAMVGARPVPPILSGVGFGLTVWASSYLGWLPAAGLFRPPSEEPARRHGLMVAAHIVWGAALGLMVHRLMDGHTPQSRQRSCQDAPRTR